MSHFGRDRLRWSAYAGLYLFVCATVTVFSLYDMLSLLADVIGLPADYAMFVLASPAFVVGTVVWWAIVERRGSYSYLLGSAVGLVTALLTGFLWTARFVSVWGIEMLGVGIVPLLVALVLGFVAVAGTITGLPLMYARRRLDGELSGDRDPAC